VFEVCCCKTLDIVLCILLLIIKYAYKRSNVIKTLINYAEMLRLVSDIFFMLILYS